MKPLLIVSMALFFGAGAFAQPGTSFNGCPVFPTNNIWNRTIDTMPLSSHSADYVNNITASGGLRWDAVIGITVVSGTQPKVPINISYPPESDPGPYPFPSTAVVEPGDRHVIVVDKDNCVLYETYNSVLQPDGSWNVDSAAKWSLLSNALRPPTWTSADAAGLPIMAGLVRYEEILAGEITHAIRFTAPRTQRKYVWPGRHYASTNTSAALPPMGQRFRLKAGFDISGFSPHMQVILRALKKYGVMLADNGLAWEMQLAADPRWDEAELLTLRSVIGSNFEAVEVSSVMVNADSGEAAQPNVVSVTVSPATVTLSASQSRQFNASVSGSSLGVVWSMSPVVGTLSASGLYTAPSAVSATQNVTIRATLADGSKSGTATVTLQPAPPAALASVAVSPSSIVGGNQVSVTVTLTGAAPSGGAAVALTGSNAAFPAAGVVVAANAVFQTFSLPTAVVTANTAVTITAAYNGVSVISSQLTVMPALPPVSGGASATFVRTDTTTRGSWKGVYGADGFNVINDKASYPSYVTVTPSGYSLYTWAASTTDARGLQKSPSTTDRIAACWYSSAYFNIDLNFHDSLTHQVALYLVDWDNWFGRTQRVDIVDANNTVLDTRTVTSFTGGQYLVWNLSGHVTIRMMNTNSRSNAVASGIFFGSSGAPVGNSPATASFLKTDTTTLGTWKGVYGADGSSLVGDATSYPPYVTATASGYSLYTWAASTTDPRSLQKSTSTADRIAACWYSSGSFKIDLSFSDSATHQVALYLVDWDNWFGRTQRVDIVDANNTVLDTRTVTNFIGGQYLVWNLSGHVTIRLTNTNSRSNAVISGIFFR